MVDRDEVRKAVRDLEHTYRERPWELCASVRERMERAEREADAFMERLMPADNVVDLAAWRRRRGR